MTTTILKPYLEVKGGQAAHITHALNMHGVALHKRQHGACMT